MHGLKRSALIVLAGVLGVISSGCTAIHPASVPLAGRAAGTPSAAPVSASGDSDRLAASEAAIGTADADVGNRPTAAGEPAMPSGDGAAADSATEPASDRPGSADGADANQGRDGGAAVPNPDPADYEVYKGPVEHIFFHPLILYPQLAFDHDSMSKGFDEWFVTVPEFQKILDQLYANDYMLIDIHALYRQEQQDGQPELVRTELKMPKGKKPLILSVDDLNYYDYMRANGLGSKLVLDDQGRVAVYGKDPDGHAFTSREAGIVPLLDRFVEDHPDFSLNGAKGIINETGYEGVLGYRTNDTKAADYETEKTQAKLVIQAMKKNGWTFASHGWGHLHDQAISYARFVADTDRWLKEVEPLTGPTDLYVFPFGEYVPPHGKKYDYLVAKGFRGIIGIGPRPYLHFYSDSFEMDRRHIDGISLETQGKSLAPLFDAKSVLDPERIRLLGQDLYAKSTGN